MAYFLALFTKINPNVDQQPVGENNVLGCFNLKICSQNIQGQGLNDKDKKKLRKLGKIFKDKKYNVGFFQETRTDNSD